MGFLQKIADAVGMGDGGGGAPPRPAGPHGIPKIGADYMRGNQGLVFSGWRPALRENQDEVSRSWQLAAARSLDAIHNSGWLAGTVAQATADTVGTGLRLNLTPDQVALGITDPRKAAIWARDVERRFKIWCDDPLECDIEGRRTFGAMQEAAFLQWFPTGEIVAEIGFKRRLGRTWGTKVRLLPPYRLSPRTDIGARIVHGVRMDEDGLPIGYLFRTAPQSLSSAEYEVAARDAMGRPKIIHAFQGLPATVRGISPLTPALRVARQFDQLSDATLMASIVQSVFAATVTSETPTEDVLSGLLTPEEQAEATGAGLATWDAWFDAQAGWYDKTALDVGINGRIAHLFPGQKMEFHTAKSLSAGYEPMAKHLLRELARCIGVTYETATGDYAGVTFSSIRMATNSIFETVKARRKNILRPFCQPVFEAWLEEEIAFGRVVIPGGLDRFIENRSLICRAEWFGSPKPQPDDVKTATAHKLWRSMKVMSDSEIAADRGVDLEDVYADLQREQQLRDEYGVSDPVDTELPPPEPAPEPAQKAEE